MDTGAFLLFILVLLGISTLPAWSYSRDWGYQPRQLHARRSGRPDARSDGPSIDRQRA
ncbi:DUF3309 family protein [Microvirga sp. GCM10011540]|uniref:DUF3309 family protein n=1 Tax=Microvirga sp. GCM10011540 TaxID=3317338 RepID=UPI003607914B